MNIKQAYNSWASQYDTNENKTRDLEATALREVLEEIEFDNCLELGCGTGKNTEWLITKAKHVTGVDLSEEMLNKAKEKISSDKVRFLLANMNSNNDYSDRMYDLVTFSLVMEHVENIDPVLKKVSKTLNSGGYIYIGELHPFKQYAGSKARFETEQGTQIVPCFNHHISDFTGWATKNNFEVKEIREYFDDNDRNNLPRVLALLLRKL
jgi:ubiquinone/menaquinone biosynthesis C-methylase UbiE